MTANSDFLNVIKESFHFYLKKGTSRSTAKLKILHGTVASDIAEIFGEGFTVASQGFGQNREEAVDGRYYPKKVDITVSKDGKPVAGFGVKFVMRNYTQNSNNYFENMLGETANIRSNKIPFFQIFIVFDKLPYYDKSGKLKIYQTLSAHSMQKYFALSKDDPAVYMHTPDKTLLIVLTLKEKAPSYPFSTEKEYGEYYLSVISDGELLSYSDAVKDEFDNTVILNDYERFIRKAYNIAEGKLK